MTWWGSRWNKGDDADWQHAPSPDQDRSLVMYSSRSCGYCGRVKRHLEKLGLVVTTRELQGGPSVREELIEKTGRGQVPCLFIDDQPLFESADIMEWLSRYAEKSPKSP